MYASLFLALAQLVHAVLSLFTVAVLIRVVLSWIRPDPPPGPVRALLAGLYGLVDPILAWVRRRLPFVVIGGLDLSPVVVILGLQFLDTFLTGTLVALARG